MDPSIDKNQHFNPFASPLSRPAGRVGSWVRGGMPAIGVLFRKMQLKGVRRRALFLITISRSSHDSSFDRLFLLEEPPLMLRLAFRVSVLFVALMGAAVGSSSSARAQDDIVSEVASVEESLTAAFNAADVDAVVNAFLADGELIDESGLLYRGHDELKDLFSQYFAKFPGAKLSLQIDSIRKIGDQVAIEEGTRFLAAGDSAFAQVRYIATLSKKDGKWKLASIREFDDQPAPTSGDRLQTLAWLVGDWISESSELAVRISYRWDEDKNFLVGKFLATRGGQVVLKTEQRIGWDPLTGKIRSWMFDSDGGFGGGLWTPTQEGWVIKSESTQTDGSIGFATVYYRQLDQDRYQMIGTDRLIGDETAEDFDVTVTRAPPKPTRPGTATKE